MTPIYAAFNYLFDSKYNIIIFPTKYVFVFLIWNIFQNLLEVVHDLFEEQTSLEKVILKIMQRAQRLLKCEKAAVLLVDENSDVRIDVIIYIFISFF